MKKYIAILVIVAVLWLMPLALATDITSQIDYSALEIYIESWNAAVDGLGMSLSFDMSHGENYITFSATLLSSEPYQVNIIDSLSDPNIPTDLMMQYFSDDNSIALIYGRPTITEIPQMVEIYADGVNCGGRVEFYPAEDEDQTDLYVLLFDLTSIQAILNANDSFMRLVTEDGTYFQEMNSATWIAPYFMWNVISEGINYSNKLSEHYLDPALLGQGADSAQQPTVTVEPVRSFQTDYEAIDRAAQSVFLLEVYDDSNQVIATGSGFVAFDSGTLITNEHVINDAAYIIAYSDQYKALYKLLNLKAVDKNRDIAILEFDVNATVTPLSLDVESRLLRGQPVTAIGSPQGIINTVSSGNISNIVFYSEEIPDCIQFTAPISPGSSGGALFDDNGEVIGLCVSSLREGDAMYYAIPMKYVEETYLTIHDKKVITLAQYNDMPSHLPAVELQTPRLVNNCIEINWSAVNLAEEYEVYRCAADTLEFTRIATTSNTQYTDNDVTIGTKYEYYVKAIHSWCSSAPSDIVAFTMIEPTPTPTATPTPTPAPTRIPRGKTIFDLGDTDDGIIDIKLRLYELGYYSSNASYDGTYNGTLKNAVKSFQRKNNLAPTGVFDETTKNALSMPNVEKGKLEVPREPEEYSRKLYRLNDEGNEIEKLKFRLQELGYYRSSSDFDNEFNQTMVERVKQFQKNNKLDESGVIDYVTLIKLYSSQAEKGQWYVIPTPTPAPEKNVTLEIPDGSYGQWDYVNGDNLKFRLQVKNTSKIRTIKAYELYVYPVDVWGNRLIPEDKVYIISVETDLAPGKQHYSNYITMGDAKKIDKVYVAVNKVKYSDGKIETVDYHNYSYWEID